MPSEQARIKARYGGKRDEAMTGRPRSLGARRQWRNTPPQGEAPGLFELELVEPEREGRWRE